MITTTTTLQQVQALAIKLINTSWIIDGIHEVNIGDLGYSFDWDNARRRFGCCNYTFKIISLSKPLCSKNLDNMEQIEDTIRHEIAHAITLHIYGRGAKGHGHEWKSVCIDVGANPTRCYDGDSVESVESKYTLICDNCNKETPMHKLSRRMKAGGSKACGVCCRANGGGYQERFKLRFVQNY